MYIQKKKIIIILIFLLSIIFMSFIRNSDLSKNILDILIVSPEDDITSEGVTKRVITDIANYNSTNDENKNILNYNFLEIKNDVSFEATLDEQLENKDIVIVIGEYYNKNLSPVIQNNANIKFILLNNYADFNFENAFKINISKDDILNEVINYFNSERNRLIKDKVISSDDVLEINYLNASKLDDFYSELQEGLDENKFTLVGNNYSYFSSNAFKNDYNDSNYYYLINFDFDNQQDIINKLVGAQKDNVYSYFKDINENKPVEYSEDDEDEKNDKIEYIPISYIGFYEGDKEIGGFDKLSGNTISHENIIKSSFDVSYETDVLNIILNKSEKKEYNLNKADGTLIFDINNEEE